MTDTKSKLKTLSNPQEEGRPTKMSDEHAEVEEIGIEAKAIEVNTATATTMALPPLDRVQNDNLAVLGNLIYHIGDTEGNRIKILYHLRISPTGELNVKTLAQLIGLTDSGVSQHLNKMKSQGIVKSQRVKQSQMYSINKELVYDLMSEIAGVFGWIIATD